MNFCDIVLEKEKYLIIRKPRHVLMISAKTTLTTVKSVSMKDPKKNVC